jgi:ABC-2 type transport system ATP-binding protein
MSGEVALRTERLGKRYRRTWALRDCTLTLPAGRVIALVGPNGAGKTTLLRLTVGLLGATEGTVDVFGLSPETNTPQALARVGFVAQEHPLYRRFTVADLLRFGRACNVRFDQQVAERRLARLEIPLHRRAATLSGGQQAQVALALALAKRPDLLVLDEPLASLDPVARREFLETLMAAVADEGVTVLFSSHVISELERVCDHLVLLNHGRVQLAGDLDALGAEHRMLVGPRTDVDAGHAATVIQVTHAERHTTLLVRDGAAAPAPGWQSHPVSLEDMVLAYLRRPAHADSRSMPAEVAAGSG